ncbi:hypothetical protein KUTeg_023319 [Tegillarca granosa]|uniref:Uncharacterized protein n=1 Tax=Tegillarca granosa TaxID=220873 RepID=A0ABQ9E1P3_TEGGR|nr:hypothetical protein KUTeg_023319 [Tegillarca granosa]
MNSKNSPHKGVVTDLGKLRNSMHHEEKKINTGHSKNSSPQEEKITLTGKVNSLPHEENVTKRSIGKAKNFYSKEEKILLTPKMNNSEENKISMGKSDSSSPNEEKTPLIGRTKLNNKENIPKKHEHGNQTPGLPDIPSLNRREDTKEMLCHAENTDMATPYSVVERRVTRVRNAMHGNILRKSTKKLQDDLRQTMRTYSSEKQQLLKQLANLRHEIDDMKIGDGSISPSTYSDFSQRTSRSNKSRYFHAPDIAAQKAGKNSQKQDGNLTDRSNIQSTRLATKDPTKEGILKLPAIPGVTGNNKPNQNLNSNSNSSIWYSGKNLVEKNNNVPEAFDNSDSSKSAEMLKENYQIPKISDPMRNDITFSKSKMKDKKKVHFANVQPETIVKNYYAQSADQTAKDNHSKNLKSGEAENLPHIPTKISRKNNHKGHKKFRAYDKSYGKLPPIDEVKLGTYNYESQQAAENYKAMYVSITNPEERMKTLADILYAQLKQLKGVPNNTAARIGRRSTGTQLQNYLRKMSRSRRMIEHMEVEEARLAHMGHQHLIAAHA